MWKLPPNESLRDRQELLATAGVQLSFPAFSILGVNGEEVHVEVLNTGMQNLHAIDYYFQVLEEDVTFYNITARDVFTVDTSETRLHFEVSHVRRDAYSWVRMDAILRREERLAASPVPYDPVNPFTSLIPSTGVYNV